MTLPHHYSGSLPDNELNTLEVSRALKFCLEGIGESSYLISRSNGFDRNRILISVFEKLNNIEGILQELRISCWKASLKD